MWETHYDTYPSNFYIHENSGPNSFDRRRYDCNCHDYCYGIFTVLAFDNYAAGLTFMLCDIVFTSEMLLALPPYAFVCILSIIVFTL